MGIRCVSGIHMELRLPPFKTRDARVEHMTIRDKQATAIMRVNETRWWGFKKRDLCVVINCRKITRKQPEWATYVKWEDGYMVAPVCSDSDVLEVANRTLRDMRNLNFKQFEQLLAYRLSIHIRKHHGKALAAHL